MKRLAATLALLLLFPILDSHAWVLNDSASSSRGEKLGCFHDRTLIETAAKMRLFPRCSITAFGGTEFTAMASDRYSDVIQSFHTDEKTTYSTIEGKKDRKVKYVDRKYFTDHYSRSMQLVYCAGCKYVFSVQFLL